MENIRKIFMNRKILSIFLFFLFVIWQIILIVHYEGWYHFDELYHISSCNMEFDAVSRYSRAPQINWSIKVLTQLFGKSYYTYKLIPFVLSSIVMAILLYLTSKLTKHRVMLVCVSLLMSGQCLLVIYHISVRFYVWNEAVIAVLALLLYWISQTARRHQRLVLHACYFFLASFTYFLHPSEESYLAILMTAVVAWGVNIIGPTALIWLEKRKLNVWLLIFCCILVVALEIYVIAFKKEIIAIPGFAVRFEEIGTKTLEYFYIPKYFLRHLLLFVAAMVVCGIYLVMGKMEKNVLGLYMMALLPFLAYNIFFSDIYILRGVASYIPMMILVTVLWLDKWKLGRLFDFIVIGITIVAVWFSYPELNVVQFYREPDIPGEFNLNDYGSLVSKAKEEIANGRKCIAIWANDHQEASFDLDATYSFAINDSVNDPHNITEDEILELFVFLRSTDEKYILLIGPHTNFRIDEILPGFMYGLKAEFPYDEFQYYEYLIYIN